MTTYISSALRQLVATRAQHLCEYCLIHEDDAFFGCEVDHIISEKHDGQTEAENLAFACAFCNRSKGSDVGSVEKNSEPSQSLLVRCDVNQRMLVGGEHEA